MGLKKKITFDFEKMKAFKGDIGQYGCAFCESVVKNEGETWWDWGGENHGSLTICNVCMSKELESWVFKYLQTIFQFLNIYFMVFVKLKMCSRRRR